jgi:hypothetical protein
MGIPFWAPFITFLAEVSKLVEWLSWQHICYMLEWRRFMLILADGLKLEEMLKIVEYHTKMKEFE